MLTIREECELHARREALMEARVGAGVGLFGAVVLGVVGVACHFPGLIKGSIFLAAVVVAFGAVAVRLRRRIRELEELAA